MTGLEQFDALASAVEDQLSTWLDGKRLEYLVADRLGVMEAATVLADVRYMGEMVRQGMAGRSLPCRGCAVSIDGVAEPDDPLNPARGLLVAAILGVILWSVAICVACHWW